MKFATKTASKSKPKPFSCRLIPGGVEIQGVSYNVTPYDYNSLGMGFQIVKSGLEEQCYNVVHDEHSGLNVCDCPDYQYRRHGTGDACKHIRALVALDLLPERKF